MTLVLALLCSAMPPAEDLYKRSTWSSLAADRKAGDVGDALTVVVYEAAETTNSVRSDSRRTTQVAGSLRGPGLSEEAGLQAGGGYTGGGAVQRSDKVIAQITVTVRRLLPNGDLVVAGEQAMRLNGEDTLIGIEGRVRREDILGDNRVLSSRLADARVTYNGRGFVAGSAKPGVIARVFRFLGIG